MVRPPLREHDRQRLADDVTAADDDHVFAGHVEAAPPQNLTNSLRRARQKPRTTLDHPPDVLRMKCVDVFGRADGMEHTVGADLLRQWELHQDAVDFGVLVEPGDQFE